MKKTKVRGQNSRDIVRLARLYGCGVSGLKKVAKSSKKPKHTKSAFAYNSEDLARVKNKLQHSDFLISHGVENFEGYEHYYIDLLDLKDIFEKSFIIKFTSAEIAAFVQEHKCTEVDKQREVRIVFNNVLKELKLLGNTLRAQNYCKVREGNAALSEFRLKHFELQKEEPLRVHLEPSALFNTLWEIHDAACKHWELKTKKFMQLLHDNFTKPTGVMICISIPFLLTAF